MTKSREIRCYDYVNRPSEQVTEALTQHATDVFHGATKEAVSRAESVAAGLKVNLAGVEIGTDVAIEVKGVSTRPPSGKIPEATVIELEWEAARSPRLFPIMHAELFVYPLSNEETQLVFVGHYEPPMGILGRSMDAMVGHHVAEASVHRFIREVAEYLRQKLPR